MTELQSKLPVRNDPFWPAAVITLGISLTTAWVILLGYGLVRLGRACDLEEGASQSIIEVLMWVCSPDGQATMNIDGSIAAKNPSRNFKNAVAKRRSCASAWQSRVTMHRPQDKI